MAGDAALAVGVIIAAALTIWTGWLWLDPIASIIIAAAILVSGWRLARDSVNLAMDGVPAGIDPGEVESCLRKLPGVHEVHDLHIWAMSTTEVALTAHLVRPEAGLDDHFLGHATDELAHRFAIRHATLQVEAGDHACPLAPKDVV